MNRHNLSSTAVYLPQVLCEQNNLSKCSIKQSTVNFSNSFCDLKPVHQTLDPSYCNSPGNLINPNSSFMDLGPCEGPQESSFNTSVFNSTTFSTPGKNRGRLQHLQSETTSSDYESALDRSRSMNRVSFDEESTRDDIRSYLGSFDCGEDSEQDIEQAEVSKLEELMKSPDVKTAHQLLSTLADFSPSNPFRSPLKLPSTPTAAGTKFVAEPSENSCSSLSLQDVPKLISATSTPFAPRPEKIVQPSKFPQSVANLSDFEENTVLYTPKLNKTTRVLYQGSETPLAPKALPQHLLRRSFSSPSRPRTSTKMEPDVSIEKLPLSRSLFEPNSTPVNAILSPKVSTSALGRVRFREHSRNSVYDSSFSNKSPLVVVKPFERASGSQILHLEKHIRSSNVPLSENFAVNSAPRTQVAAPIQGIRKRRKRFSKLSPFKPSARPFANIISSQSGQQSNIFKSYCCEMFKVKVRHAVLQHQQRAAQPKPVRLPFFHTNFFHQKKLPFRFSINNCSVEQPKPKLSSHRKLSCSF